MPSLPSSSAPSSAPVGAARNDGVPADGGGGRSVWLVGLVLAAAAAVANLVVLGVAKAADVSMVVPAMQQGSAPVDIGAGLVVTASVVGVVLGTVLWWGLRRFVARPVVPFVVVATLGTVLSLGGPLGLDVGSGTKAALDAMHLVVGVVVVGGHLLAARRP